MKVALVTLGCRVNQSESSVLEGTLKENGITIVDLKETPDICVVNTCTVTAKSDYNSRQVIRRAARTCARVIVTGCYSQLRTKEIGDIPGMIEIVDIEKKYDIVDMITGKNTDLSFCSHRYSRPFLKVQDGCNLRCSYCSVHLARGRSRSVPVEKVIERLLQIESKGYNEVVITGIHLGAYGHDLERKSSLKELLKVIFLKTSIKRIRLSSLEVNEVDEEFIDLMQEDRICKHLHLPLQSGSNNILKLMKRNYTADFFSEKIKAIARRVKNVSLGSDIIVGFPHEEHDDFLATLNMIEDLSFSYLHIFPFSPRPETEAAKMKNRIPQAIVSERLKALIDLKQRKKKRYMDGQIGNRLDVILEEKIDENAAVGTSGNYLRVRVPASEYMRGTIVFVRPVRVINDMIEGIVVE